MYRVTLKDLPAGGGPDVTYTYDNLGRLKSAVQTGISLSFTYDALGRNLTQTGPQGTICSEWDQAHQADLPDVELRRSQRLLHCLQLAGNRRNPAHL